VSDFDDALDTLGLSPPVKQCLRDIHEHLENNYRASIDRLTNETNKLCTELEHERERLRISQQCAKGAAETIFRQSTYIEQLCLRISRWKRVAAEYKRRCLASLEREAVTCAMALSEHNACDRGKVERDALRQRVAELEQRLDHVPCGWTEAPPAYPCKRVRAKSVEGT